MAATVYAGNFFVSALGSYPHTGGRGLAHPLLTAQWVTYLSVGTFAFRDRLRRRTCTPLDPVTFPAVVRRVNALSKEMCVRNAPTLLKENRRDKNRGTGPGSNRFGMRPYAMASGTDLLGLRPYLALGPVMLALGSKDEEEEQELANSFDAIVRHELAHLRNRDIPLHNLATGVRWANGAQVLAVVPVSLVFGILDGRWELIGSAGGALLFALAVELMVLEFYRAREDYADQRAAQYGENGAEDLAWALYDDRTGPRHKRPVNRPFEHPPHLFSPHRPSRQRASLIRDPAPLLRFSPGYALLAGFLVGALLATVPHALSVWYDYGPAKDGIVIATAALAGAPLGVFAALGMWRHTRNSEAAGRPPQPLRQAGLLALGVLVGTALTPYGSDSAGIPLAPLPLISLFACCTLLTCWPWAVARAVSAPSRTPRASHAGYLLLLTVGAALVGTGAFALLLLGGFEVLAFCALVTAAPLLALRVVFFAAPAQLTDRIRRVVRTGGTTVLAAWTLVLLVTSTAAAKESVRMIEEGNERVRLMLAALGDRQAWILAFSLAAFIVAALGPRGTGGPGRLRRTVLVMGLVLATVTTAGAWRSPDPERPLYCSPYSPWDGWVIVDLGSDEEGMTSSDRLRTVETDLQAVQDAVGRHAVNGTPQYENWEQTFRRALRMQLPAATAATAETMHAATYRFELRDPATFPELRTALLGLAPEGRLEPRHVHPCHPHQ
ncbi:M48 family metalloprotease [Streptomyces sp. AP-93]|uniref:M48 family metalloprotease n=1 Tax=Streptomyces sp. AP-93 TaxID=2929048 RepID=UPI001FAF8A20|nr:M48 family metalloprotease [Streptomyces sp. AP-93]MCJ0869712.1 M48 family metallopeptidase [Streptomyces sp. AP-93]